MEIETRRFKTKNPYEQTFGYSRAIRRGPFIFVSGTTSIDPSTGILLHPASAYDQAVQIFKEIIRAIEAVGGQKGDIMRVSMFVTRDRDADDVGRALKDSLGDVAPAGTMVMGARFVDADMLVEIEADAVTEWNYGTSSSSRL